MGWRGRGDSLKWHFGPDLGPAHGPDSAGGVGAWVQCAPGGDRGLLWQGQVHTTLQRATGTLIDIWDVTRCRRFSKPAKCQHLTLPPPQKEHTHFFQCSPRPKGEGTSPRLSQDTVSVLWDHL